MKTGTKIDYDAEAREFNVLLEEFEQENKNLSLNGKIELLRKGAKENKEEFRNYGWTEKTSRLYGHHLQKRDLEIKNKLRKLFEGLHYSEAKELLGDYRNELMDEAMKNKI